MFYASPLCAFRDEMCLQKEARGKAIFSGLPISGCLRLWPVPLVSISDVPTLFVIYCIYTYVHTLNTNTLCFGRWRPFLLDSKLHPLFSLSTFTVCFPVLRFNSRRIHWSSIDSYVM